MQALFDFVMQHPFWALYLAVLCGIAIHGFRTNRNYYTNNDDSNNTEQ